jgi:hypothetical protein
VCVCVRACECVCVCANDVGCSRRTHSLIAGDDGSTYAVTSPFTIDRVFALSTGLLVQRCLAAEMNGPQVSQCRVHAAPPLCSSVEPCEISAVLTHTHTHTRARARTHIHTHTRTHAQTYTHTHTHTHTHTRTHTHTSLTSSHHPSACPWIHISLCFAAVFTAASARRAHSGRRSYGASGRWPHERCLRGRHNDRRVSSNIGSSSTNSTTPPRCAWRGATARRLSSCGCQGRVHARALGLPRPPR